jgi:hypothetical protein
MTDSIEDEDGAGMKGRGAGTPGKVSQCIQSIVVKDDAANQGNLLEPRQPAIEPLQSSFDEPELGSRLLDPRSQSFQGSS